eukprot:10416436-Prorocentrum_lima.AAC.1
MCLPGVHLPSAGRLAKCERRPAGPARAASPRRAPALQCQRKKSVRRRGARFAFAVACSCSTIPPHCMRRQV